MMFHVFLEILQKVNAGTRKSTPFCSPPHRPPENPFANSTQKKTSVFYQVFSWNLLTSKIWRKPSALSTNVLRIEGSPVEENSLRINPMVLSSMSVSLLMSELASVKRTTSRLSSNVASCKGVDRIFADFFDIWTSFRQEAIKFHMAFLLCKGVEPPHLPAPANAHIWGCYNCWQDTAGTNLSTHRQNWFASLDPAAFPGRLEEFEHRQWHKQW